MPLNPQHITLQNTLKHDKASEKKPVIQNYSAIEGEFAFDNCIDIHVGPKYERSNNIVINQNISLTSEGELSKECHKALKEELESTINGAVTYKHSINQWPLTFGTINFIIFIFTLLFIIIIIIILRLTKGDISINQSINETVSQNSNEKTERTPSLPIEENLYDYPKSYQFVLREKWGATEPHDELRDNILPLKRVIFIHTVSAGTCNKFEACKQQMQIIQDLHMDAEHDYGDIGYNFVLGSDGLIYVGIGWDKVGSHTYGYNTGSLGVAFIGDFRKDEPNELMLSAAKRLLELGVKRKKLSEDYQLFGHCQVLSEFPYSPGKNILNRIKTWPHWNDTYVTNCVKS